MSRKPGRPRLSAGDALLALSLLALAAGLATPWVENALLLRRADQVSRSVDALTTAAVRYHDAEGAWPPSDRPGAVPVAVAPLLPTEAILSHSAWALQWNSWEAVSPSPPPMPPAGPPGVARAPGHLPPPALDPVVGQVAGLTVHAKDRRLLGLLLHRYGGARSFVRDSTWTLVVARPDRGS